jgi:hypothetical protein
MVERNLTEAIDHGDEFIADIGFEPAFTLTIEHDVAERIAGPGGTRLFRKINGGTITGRITGTIYGNGGGEYSLLRPDGVTEISEHVLLRTQTGEWLYLFNMGYARPDGYHRTTSWVDTDVRGQLEWTAGLFFIGMGHMAADGRSTTIHYFEVA